MTYQNLRTKVVEEQREMTPKAFRRFMLRYAMMLLTLAFEFMLVVSSIVNYYVALVTGIIFILAFIWLLDWCGEDKKTLGIVRKLSRVWFLNILLIVGTFFILKVTHFL